ncbi:homoserine dehydrogenase [hydrocarbon metagenome]|uniref:Homoserine dehydrogenase n=1 Tax=hydrocarbon metagenome TaxID=938273 RepID=A0A0W8FP06_9ZZZZ
MKKNKSIDFILLGAGSVGKGVFHQSLITPDVNCKVICDIDVNKALALFDSKRQTKTVYSEGELADALKQNKIAVCQDARLAATAPDVEVFFDASTAIDSAPSIIESAMASGKHVIMMNAEADAVFGPWFWHLAQKNGVAYTSSDGDQPAVIARLVAELRFYGLELVMAGNIKGFLDRYTDPVKIRPEADKRGLDYQMCSSYTDGTKLCVEMSIVANALSCSVLKAGMTGPRMAEATDMFNHFSFSDIWKSGQEPLVDYILGAKPKGGVFAVGYTDDAYQRRMLDWFPPEIGPGPFYVLTRPYHLIHLESMRTILEVSNTKKSLIAPRHGMRTEVICYAKKDLQEGELLDGPGGFSSYGLIENRADGSNTGLPIILSMNTRLLRAVKKDERIGWNDVDISSIPVNALTAWQKACKIAL